MLISQKTKKHIAGPVANPVHTGKICPSDCNEGIQSLSIW